MTVPDFLDLVCCALLGLVIGYCLSRWFLSIKDREL